MRGKSWYKTAWLILFALVIAAALMVLIPMWLIQPFAAQTARNLEISFLLKSWSPLLTAFLTIVAAGLIVYIWKNSSRWFGKAFLLVPLVFVLGFAWLARQNHFEWMFNPLAEAKYARATEADFVADDEMVLAVNIGGEAVAYPVRLMAYHHLVADVVGGKPITATY